VDCISVLEVAGVIKGVVLSDVGDDRGDAVYSRCGYFSTVKGASFGANLADGNTTMLDVTIV
jgi:hypothetical protein